MATESEDNMKAKEYKNIVNYVQHKFLPISVKTKNERYIFREDQKGVTTCIAKECNEPLYHNKSTSNPKYCMRCGG